MMLRNVCAQSLQNKDTIYYLIDTIHVPKNDRMLEAGTEGLFKYYTIKCACLSYNNKPTFIYKLGSKNLYLKKTSNYKFISLANLIDLIRRTNYKLFKEKYVTIFVEPENNRFVSKRVFLIEARKQDSVIDYEVVSGDPPTNH